MEEKKRKLNKRLITSIAVLLFSIALLIVGLTLAFFSGKDEATNQFSSESYEIKLFENKWSGGGVSLADKTEPGEDIAKDPSVANASHDDVYVRLKLEFIYDSKAYTLDDIATGGTPEKERLQKVLGAIYRYDSDDKLVPFFNGTPVADGSENRLYTPDFSGIQSTNPRFFYYNGWFYYLKEGVSFDPDAADASAIFEAIAPDASTETLFDTVCVPNLKDEFYGSFDKPFSIKVYAEGTPVEKDTKTNNPVVKSVSKVISGF